MTPIKAVFLVATIVAAGVRAANETHLTRKQVTGGRPVTEYTSLPLACFHHDLIGLSSEIYFDGSEITKPFAKNVPRASRSAAKRTGMESRRTFVGSASAGHLFTHPETCDVVVAFRGTATSRDVKADASNLTTPIKRKLKGVDGREVSVRVTPRFWELAEEYAKRILPALKAERKRLEESGRCFNPKVTFTGHSLGGAIAVLVAPIVERELKDPYFNSDVVVFGTPRVAMSDIYEALGYRKRATHYLVEGDPLATALTSKELGFKDLPGRTVYLGGPPRGNLWERRLSHNLENYERLVREHCRETKKQCPAFVRDLATELAHGAVPERDMKDAYARCESRGLDRNEVGRILLRDKTLRETYVTRLHEIFLRRPPGSVEHYSRVVAGLGPDAARWAIQNSDEAKGIPNDCEHRVSRAQAALYLSVGSHGNGFAFPKQAVRTAVELCEDGFTEEWKLKEALLKHPEVKTWYDEASRKRFDEQFGALAKAYDQNVKSGAPSPKPLSPLEIQTLRWGSSVSAMRLSGACSGEEAERLRELRFKDDAEAEMWLKPYPELLDQYRKRKG